MHAFCKDTCKVWAWWNKSVIPALRKLMQEDCKFEVSLGYIVRSCHKIKEMEGKEGKKEERKEEREGGRKRGRNGGREKGR
jgi:hypothetical protein